MVKNPPANAGDTRDVGSISRRSPGVGNGNCAPVFLPEKSHGQRSHKESHMTESTRARARTHTHTHTHTHTYTHTHTCLVQIGGDSAPHCPLEMDPAEAASLVAVLPAIRHAQAGSIWTERLQVVSEFLIISASKRHFASIHRSLAVTAT